MVRWRLTSGGARWLRGTVVGLLTVLLGTGAHVAAGGHAPSQIVTLTMTMAVTVLAVALSGARWSVGPLLGLFLLGQTGIHLASMSSAPHGSMLDPLMATTHLVAAGALVLLVLQGERALLALLDLAVPPVLRPEPTTPPVADSLLVVRPDVVVLPRWIPSELRGRAPPVFC